MRLTAPPLLDLLAAAGGGEAGEVGRRAVRVGVGEADGDRAGAAALVQRRLGGAADLLDEGVEPVPGDRGLEGLRQHAHRDEGVAQVGRAQERVAPGARSSRALPSRSSHSPPCAAQIASARVHALVDGQRRADSKPSTSSACAAVAGEGQRRLARVDQPAVGGPQPGLHDLAHGGGSRARSRRSARPPSGGGPGAGMHAHPRLRDHAERPLRRRAACGRARARRPSPAAAATPTAPRPACSARTDSTRSSMCVGPRREVPAGARRDPAAERRELERLRDRSASSGRARRAAARAPGPVAPAWIRAAREMSSTSSTRSSARSDSAIAPLCPGPGRASMPPTTLVPPPTGETATRCADAHVEHGRDVLPRHARARRSRAACGTLAAEAAHDVAVGAARGRTARGRRRRRSRTPRARRDRDARRGQRERLQRDRRLDLARRRSRGARAGRAAVAWTSSGAGCSSSKPQPQCLRRRAPIRRNLSRLTRRHTLDACPIARHPRARTLAARRGVGALARGRLRAAPGPHAAADAAIAALEDRGSPSHDGLGRAAGRLRARERRPRRSSCSRCAGACAWWRTTRRPRSSVLCVARDDDGRWLAGRRAAWVATWAGRWALGAGGAVEVGEDPVETLARELQEEWAVTAERMQVEALVCLPNRLVDARRPGLAPARRRGHDGPRARRARLVARRPERAGPTRPTRALVPDGDAAVRRAVSARCGPPPPARSPTCTRRSTSSCSASRSSTATTTSSPCSDGSHGFGWIGMSLLCLEAVRRRTIPLWLGVMVAVVGGVGPFAGSIGFYAEKRRAARRI